jgi:hypothetical protein
MDFNRLAHGRLKTAFGRQEILYRQSCKMQSVKRSKEFVSAGSL